MNVAEALADGWVFSDDVTYQKGYVSRKGFDRYSAEVHEGKGFRKGQLYFLSPCYHTTQYCFRTYLKRE